MAYVGKSMSVRAAAAYRRGEAPLSKWSKGKLLEEAKLSGASPDAIAQMQEYSLPRLRKLLLHRSGRHHTGPTYRETDFYTVSLKDVPVSETPPDKVYRYYLTHRPAPHDPVAEHHFQRMSFVPGIVPKVSGYAEYGHPLALKDVIEYELIPDERNTME